MPARRSRRARTAIASALAGALLLAPFSLPAVASADAAPVTAAPVTAAADPGPDTTGSRIPRELLTPHTGDLVVTEAGAVVSGYLVTGRIVVRAADVVVRDNIVEAGVKATSSVHLIDTSHSAARRAVIEYNTVSSTAHPNIYINGIGPKSYTATGNQVFDVVDGFTAADTTAGTAPGDPVTIRGNHVHRLFYITPASTHSDNRTHNDGVQVHGGPGTVTIEGNRIDAIDSPLSTNGGGTPSLSAIMLNTNTTRYASDVTIRGNRLDGGGYAVNGIGTNGGRIAIESNTFGATRLYGPIALNISKASIWTIATSGESVNRYAADGSALAKTSTYLSGSDTIRRHF